MASVYEYGVLCSVRQYATVYGVLRRATLIVKRSSTLGALVMHDLCLIFAFAKLNSAIFLSSVQCLYIVRSICRTLVPLVSDSWFLRCLALDTSKYGVSIRRSNSVLRLVSSCFDITLQMSPVFGMRPLVSEVIFSRKSVAFRIFNCFGFFDWLSRMIGQGLDPIMS